MLQDKRQERWCMTGYDPESGANPPPNAPKPLPPHQHDNGFDSRCGLCCYLRELSKERGGMER
jgi:hypothetical protein